MYRNYADFFKGLSNPRRIKLLKLMMLADDRVTVAQLVEAFDEDASTVSRYLNHLRKLGILQTKRDGQQKYYWLDKEKLKEVIDDFLEFLSTSDEEVEAFVKALDRSSNH
jgi:DNA-binding transcriptional ArsR family regulator